MDGLVCSFVRKANTRMNEDESFSSRTKRAGHRLTLVSRMLLLCGLMVLGCLPMLLSVSEMQVLPSLSLWMEIGQPENIVRNETHTSMDNKELRANAIADYDNGATTATNTSKPYFIVHVGPPKTATSTIQEELTDLSHVLALDNYVYWGTFINTSRSTAMQMAIDMRCHHEMEKVRVDFSQNKTIARNVSNLTHAFAQIDCWRNFLQQLELYRGKSIILSDETLSYKATDFRDIGQAPMDWLALQESLQEEWNVLVVIGYRRYYQWLPSAKQQHESYRPTKPMLNKWPSAGGKVLEPLFPNFFKTPQRQWNQPYFFSDTVVTMIKPHVPIVIFNMHNDSMTIRSNFFCNVLPNAPHLCRYSLDSDEKNETERIVNPFRPPRYYDVLVTEAEARGMLDRRQHRRRQAEEAAQMFQESTLNLTVFDFPTLCPEHNELELFLNMSVDMEASTLPEFHASPQGETQHRTEFWEAAEAGMFCSIDANAVLQAEPWNAFFANGMDPQKTASAL